MAELACLEVAARRAQVIELRRRERVIGTGSGSTVGDDRGLLMVCPALEEYATNELAKDRAAAKEREELRDDRSTEAPAAPPKK